MQPPYLAGRNEMMGSYLGKSQSFIFFSWLRAVFTLIARLYARLLNVTRRPLLKKMANALFLQ